MSDRKQTEIQVVLCNDCRYAGRCTIQRALADLHSVKGGNAPTFCSFGELDRCSGKAASKKPMRKAIAIDFDGCLCRNTYPAIGEPNWRVIREAIREQQKGAGLILWTCREGELLERAVDACQRWGLTFDAVNESLSDWIDAMGTTPRKVGASEYWDDRAVNMQFNEDSKYEAGKWREIND